MSILNTNATNTIDVTNHLANETNLIDHSTTTTGTKLGENRELNEKSKSAHIAAPTATTVATTATAATMPAVTNPTSATVTVLNSSAQFPSISSDQCSDSEEDFDRTTKNLGAHKWIFNYKDVSSLNHPPPFTCHACKPPTKNDTPYTRKAFDIV